MSVGMLILRVVVGLLFIGHGTQKLFGWFGGYGLGGTAGFMGSLRYRNPKMAALSAGVFETGAGLFLAAGFLTPLAAAAIIGVMVNAAVSAKWSAGLFGGYELDLVYGVSALGLAFLGAGAYSVEAVLGWTLSGVSWGIVALGLGVVIGAAVLASRAPATAEAEPSATDEVRRAA